MHPQAMQFETDDLPRKMPAAVYVFIEVWLSDGWPVVGGVGEGTNCGPRHLDLPPEYSDACA